MTDRDLPLHDEAEARSKWRGDESLPAKDGGESGPASEIDDAARTEGGGGGGSASKGLAESPPD